MKEKRRYVRIDFERQVQLDFFTDIYNECQVENISLGGMYITGNFPNEVSDKCCVNLAQKDKQSYLILKALAKVVRHTPDGIALEFTSMSFESLMSLEMILLYQAMEESAGAEMKLPEDLPFEISDEASSLPDLFDPSLTLDG